jgi:hypothetical protein
MQPSSMNQLMNSLVKRYNIPKNSPAAPMQTQQPRKTIHQFEDTPSITELNRLKD